MATPLSNHRLRETGELGRLELAILVVVAPTSRALPTSKRRPMEAPHCACVCVGPLEQHNNNNNDDDDDELVLTTRVVLYNPLSDWLDCRPSLLLESGAIGAREEHSLFSLLLAYPRARNSNSRTGT